ncbi:uncharacterized protein LOC110237912 [Exaiptasia diaphana]|uniref:Uncharacterized protein n=1 Tax=Exaiptasia diaphana TaxID=2652724 RepID=A0A913X5A8_EXADI|nr:uncharacterized protein LOC110237912 [Exaiptasia diaphana]
MLSACFKRSTRILRHRFNATFSQKLRSCARFPYQEENVGKWFTKEIPIPHDPFHVRTINILNLTEKCPDADTFSKALKGGDVFRVLFHGTDQKSAQDIIENGVRLDKLHSETGPEDFSFGRGFYLTENLEREVRGALFWAFDSPSCNAKQAVLVFKIPNDVIDKYRANAKILSYHNQEELRSFVEKFRAGETLQRELEKILENVSYVEGPEVKMLGKRIVDVLEGTHQICILSEELAKWFDRHLDSAVFVNKQ